MFSYLLREGNQPKSNQTNYTDAFGTVILLVYYSVCSLNPNPNQPHLAQPYKCIYQFWFMSDEGEERRNRQSVDSVAQIYVHINKVVNRLEHYQIRLAANVSWLLHVWSPHRLEGSPRLYKFMSTEKLPSVAAPTGSPSSTKIKSQPSAPIESTSSLSLTEGASVTDSGNSAKRASRKKSQLS